MTMVKARVMANLPPLIVDVAERLCCWGEMLSITMLLRRDRLASIFPVSLEEGTGPDVGLDCFDESIV